ncbi:hypothetical protein Bca52824_011433 [Brassica carinata]|uniref:Uncharacterized protein n=1 Tax=Brassica carinata TaxID=52824 RepID=A0A8X8BB52_BRACI|nr:hypothetical protein Bca52824_011433 [Brassica carinata]
MGEFSQHINTRLDQLEQPQRRGPICNQNPNVDDEDRENESIPSLNDDNPLQKRNPRRYDYLRNNGARGGTT